MKSTPIIAISIVSLFFAISGYSESKKQVAKPKQAYKVKEAPSLDFAGITFGQPISIKECPSETNFGDQRSYKLDMQFENKGIKPEEKPCWEHTYPGKPTDLLPQNGKVRIITAINGVKDVTAQIINGSVEKVTLTTYGINWQERIFESLNEKYGTPKTKEVSSDQNMMGAKFSNIVAEWKFTDLSISFAGMIGDIYTGIVVAATPIAETTNKIDRQEKRNSEPKI